MYYRYYYFILYIFDKIYIDIDIGPIKTIRAIKNVNYPVPLFLLHASYYTQYFYTN